MSLGQILCFAGIYRRVGRTTNVAAIVERDHKVSTRALWNIRLQLGCSREEVTAEDEHSDPSPQSHKSKDDQLTNGALHTTSNANGFELAIMLMGENSTPQFCYHLKKKIIWADSAIPCVGLKERPKRPKIKNKITVIKEIS